MKSKFFLVLTMVVLGALALSEVKNMLHVSNKTSISHIDTAKLWNRCAAFKLDTSFFVEEAPITRLSLFESSFTIDNFIGCPVGHVEIYDYFNPIINHSEIIKQ